MVCGIASLHLRLHLSNLEKTERVFDCIEYLIDLEVEKRLFWVLGGKCIERYKVIHG